MAYATGTKNDGERRGAVLRRGNRTPAGWLIWACIAMLVTASFGASAQRVEGDRAVAQGAYNAEVAVKGQGADERRRAFSRALVQVLGKLSGDRGAASRPGVGAELRHAEKYVRSFDYRQDEGRSASGAPSFKTMLVVRFDEAAVDDLALTLALPVWPQPRPKPVLWLAIDDGSGPRLVDVKSADAARSTLDRAIERGYRLGLPGGSAAEKAVVGAIWRGDTAAVARASQRYSPPMQLIGKLYRSRGGWTADWIFVDNGKVLSRWSESGASATQLMATGADGSADALMKRYAKRPDTGPAGTYRIAFTGLRSADDYVRLSGYLQGLTVVRGMRPALATAQRMEFDLDLLSGVRGFSMMVERDGVLAALDSGRDTSIGAVGIPGTDATDGQPVTASGSVPVYTLH